MKLTHAQAVVVEWAIDPMLDIADNPEMAQEFGYTSDQLPILHGTSLDLSRCNEDSLADLLYRIEEQMVDMAEDERAYATMGMCRKLADAIRGAAA